MRIFRVQTVRQAAQEAEPVRGDVRLPARRTPAVVLVVLRIKAEQGIFRIFIQLFHELFKHHILDLAVVPADLVHRPLAHHFGKPFRMLLKRLFIIQHDIVTGTVNVNPLRHARGKSRFAPCVPARMILPKLRASHVSRCGFVPFRKW